MTAVAPVTAPPPAEDFMQPRLRHWTPGEFRRMTQAGIFGTGDSAELIDGEIYVRGHLHSWTRDEYYHLGNSGLLPPDERTELLQGRIIRKVTMNPPHVMGVFRTVEALRRVVGPALFVFSQAPVNLSTRNDPEPDAMIVSGDLLELSARPPLPAETLLAVEVSYSTLREDRIYKAGLYARADIKDYWIVNINERTLEVRREPQDGDYLSVIVYNEHEAVAPLAAPDVPVPVADLLPLQRSVNKEVLSPE